MYWKVKRVAIELRYSDSLLMFLRRAHRPEKFCEKVDVHVPSVDAAIEQLFRKGRLAEPASGTHNFSEGGKMPTMMHLITDVGRHLDV